MRTTPRLTDDVNAFGSYEIRWSEKVAGVWRSKKRSTHTADRELAELALSKFLAARGTADVQVRHKVDDVLNAYIEKWSRPRGNYEATDKYVLRAPREAFGKRDPHTITQDDIDDYVRDRLRGKHGKTPVSSSTALREVVAFQAALNWGSQKNLMVLGKPTFRFTKPAAGKRRILWLTEAQEWDILGKLHLASRSVAAMFRMGSTYGVRRGAMMSLRFGPQVDFETGMVDFKVPNARETRKRKPTVPMTAAVRLDLEVLLQQRGQGCYALDRSTPKDFAAFMDSIDYGWVTPHVLKHTAITLMRRSGRKLEEIAEATETDVETLRKTYNHFTAEEKLSVFDRGRG